MYLGSVWLARYGVVVVAVLRHGLLSMGMYPSASDDVSSQLSNAVALTIHDLRFTFPFLRGFSAPQSIRLGKWIAAFNKVPR